MVQVSIGVALAVAVTSDDPDDVVALLVNTMPPV
jgi:hypothetical protein